jgi:hypothetical protein
VSGPNVEDYTAPGWAKVGDDRWRRIDEIGGRHLMLRVSAHFYELHGLTLHIYRGPTGPVDDTWPMGDPARYDPAVHNFTHDGTHDVSSSTLVHLHEEQDVWEWLALYASNDQAQR